MRLARIRYRGTQFFHTLLAPLRPIDAAYAAERLSLSEFALFSRMSRAEQQHAIAVCRALETAGHRDPDLLTAALLHDVGKIHATPYLWDRVIAVLTEHYLPRRAIRWSRGEPRGWRRGFVIRAQHAAWGAELAEQAGSSPRTVELIRAHHDPPGGDVALAALQAADDGATEVCKTIGEAVLWR